MNHSNQLPLTSTFDYYQPQPIPVPNPAPQLETEHSSIPSFVPSGAGTEEGSDTSSVWDVDQPQARENRFIDLCQTLERQEMELSHFIGEVYGDSAQAEYDNYLDGPDDFVYGLGLSATLEYVARTTLRQLEAQAETKAQNSIDFERIRALLEFSKRWRHCEEHCEDTMAHNVDATEGFLMDIDTILGQRRDALSRVTNGTEEVVEPHQEVGGGAEPTIIHDGEAASMLVIEQIDDIRSATNITLPGPSSSCGVEGSASYGSKGIETVCRHSTVLETIGNHVLHPSDPVELHTCENAEDELRRGKARACFDSLSAEEGENIPDVKQDEQHPNECSGTPLACDSESSSSISQDVSTASHHKVNFTTLSKEDKSISTPSWSDWNESLNFLATTGVAWLCIAATIWGTASALTWLRQEEETEDD